MLSEGGVDQPRLDVAEFAYFRINFSPNLANPDDALVAVIGKPAGTIAGEETLDTIRVARLGPGSPRQSFGTVIPGVTVEVHNMPAGPDLANPHLELRVFPYSFIPLALGANWDQDVACVAFLANIGSGDDDNIGEDSTNEVNNCPSPSPSPSSTSSPSPSQTPTPSATATQTASPSVSASATRTATRTPPCLPEQLVPNQRPTFTKQVSDSNTREEIETRLCIGKNVALANVGVSSFILETSSNGVDFTTVFSMPAAGPGVCPQAWPYDPVADACVLPSGPGCRAFVVRPNAPYKFVRGTVVGVQFGEVCAFGPLSRTTSLNGERGGGTKGGGVAWGCLCALCGGATFNACVSACAHLRVHHVLGPCTGALSWVRMVRCGRCRGWPP